MITYPCAKINIGLYVVERRSDGYHNIETVFYPIPLQDALEIKPLSTTAADMPYRLQTVGFPIPGAVADNLVVRVFRDLQREFRLPPHDVWLHKRIPMGAGLGGGSSDAAAMMTLVNELHRLGISADEMERRMASYGADCPFFVRQRPVYATGIGDRFTPVALSLKGMTLVLVKPSIGIPTREAYAGITPAPPAYDLREALQQPIEEWRETVKNDFEDSVFPQHPEIAAIKQTLYDMGAVYAAMSGSGSTVYGLFRHEVPEVAAVFKDCFVFQHLLRR
jgi:4-diphosphocytidyl-2-C-methyl-D-erythritol kinase